MKLNSKSCDNIVGKRVQKKTGGLTYGDDLNDLHLPKVFACLAMYRTMLLVHSQYLKVSACLTVKGIRIYAAVCVLVESD